MSELPKGLIYAGITFTVIIMQVLIIKSRYHKYTNRDFVLFFRNGKIKSEGFGGGYFQLPFIDEIIVLPTAIQNLSVVIENIITNDRKNKSINFFISWRIQHPRDFYSSIMSSAEQSIEKINSILIKTGQAFVLNEAIRLTEEQILFERDQFRSLIIERLETEMNYYGVQITTLEINSIS